MESRALDGSIGHGTLTTNFKKPVIQSVIQLEIKSVCGKRLIYPACDISQAMLGISRTKTILYESLVYIQEMGFHIEWLGELTDKDRERIRRAAFGE